MCLGNISWLWGSRSVCRGPGRGGWLPALPCDSAENTNAEMDLGWEREQLHEDLRGVTWSVWPQYIAFPLWGCSSTQHLRNALQSPGAAKFPKPHIFQGLTCCSGCPAEVQPVEMLLHSLGAVLWAEEILQSANANRSQIRNVKFGHASGVISA